MDIVDFDFKEEDSEIFGKIYRPIATVFLKHTKKNKWRPITMIVDSGADYTLLPFWIAEALGVEIFKDTLKYETGGIGGKETVYFLKKETEAKIGPWKLRIPLGFLKRDNVPPLLGRQKFLENFAVLFYRHKTYFSKKPTDVR